MVCAGNGQLPEGDGGGARGEAGLGREGMGGDRWAFALQRLMERQVRQTS